MCDTGSLRRRGPGLCCEESWVTHSRPVCASRCTHLLQGHVEGVEGADGHVGLRQGAQGIAPTQLPQVGRVEAPAVAAAAHGAGVVTVCTVANRTAMYDQDESQGRG